MSCNVLDIVFGDNNWAYAFPDDDKIRCINLNLPENNETLHTGEAFFSRMKAKLLPLTAISDGKTQIVVTTKDGNFTDTVSVIVARGSPAGDSIALIKLYEISLHLPAWDLTKSMDTWEGVVLNENRRVVSVYDGCTIFISESLDSTIGNLTFLKHLSLAADFANKTVIIPSEIGNLTELQNLWLNDGFSGIIPPELGNLTKLEWLGLQYNFLIGSIPKELGNLVELKQLVLGHNQLSGNIPKELGNLINLKNLVLIENQLTGNIPKELGNLFNLNGLYLRNNQLTGKIPKELGELVKLKELSLRFNLLTGNIPEELGDMASLELLYLQDNQLTGEIPKELGKLKNLNDLNLSHNSLSGTIPKYLLDRFDQSSFCPQNGTKFDNLDCYK